MTFARQFSGTAVFALALAAVFTSVPMGAQTVISNETQVTTTREQGK